MRNKLYSRRGVLGSVLLTLTILVGTLPDALSAQQNAWSQVSDAGLSTLYVLDDTGAEREGVLLNLTPDSLVILGVGGRQTHFEQRHVRRIAKRGDSVRNGMLIGSAIGLLGSVLVVADPCESSASSGAAQLLIAPVPTWDIGMRLVTR
jgi:hypothetical protein